MNEDRPLIELLAAACEKHRITHHSVGDVRPGESTRTACRRDLRLLKELLPRVELSCCRELNSVEMLGHLCDFYNDVLQGGFCPHAPELFRGGDDGPVFKRVLLLMGHLRSKRFLGAKYRPLSTKIFNTIASLLSFEIKLRAIIVADLVNFCLDLAIIQEANLLESNKTLQLAPFAKSEACESSHCLDVFSLAHVFILQTCVLTIIRKLSIQSQDLENGRITASLGVDWRGSMPILLGSMRQILLNQLKSDQANQTVQCLRAKVAALELINNVVKEWKEVGAIMDIHEVVLIAASFIQWYFSCFSIIIDSRARLAELLQDILLGSVLTLPESKRGLRQNSSCVHLLVLPYFLGCVGNMHIILTTGIDVEIGLCNLILDSLDVIIGKEPKISEVASHYCSTHAIFPNLFKLLGVVNVHTRVASMNILHTFIEAHGDLLTFLSKCCRLATLSLEEVQDSEYIDELTEQRTPKKSWSSARKRKRGPSSPENHSPLILLFEQSPKRRGPRVCHFTLQVPDLATHATCMPAHVSLSDSCRCFLSEVFQSAKGIHKMTQQESRGINTSDDGRRSMLADLLGCASAVCLLLPATSLGQGSDDDRHWLSTTVKLLVDTLTECCEVLKTKLQVNNRNPCGVDSSVLSMVEVVVDVGLITLVAHNQSSAARPAQNHASIEKFWEASSHCAWMAMKAFSSVGPFFHDECASWEAFCVRCSFIMRFLSIPRKTRNCLCSFKKRDRSGASNNGLEDRVNLGVSRLHFSIKLISYSFSLPSVSKVYHESVAKRHEIESKCIPLWQKAIEIMDDAVGESKVALSPFSSIFLSLLPILIVPLTREVHRSMKSERCDELVNLGNIAAVYMVAGASFPHEKLSNIYRTIENPTKLRMGALIGLELYRSLLRLPECKIKESTVLNPALDMISLTSNEHPFMFGKINQEPHHSVASIDRAVRLSILSTACYKDRNISAADKVKQWQITKHVLMQSSHHELRSLPLAATSDHARVQKTTRIPLVLAQLLSVPFADANYHVRFYLSREFGKLLLDRKGYVLRSAFGSGGSDKPNDENKIIRQSISYLFGEIDCELASSDSHASSEEPRTSEDISIERQYTTLRTVASLCENTNHDDAFGQAIFRNAFLRLVRDWVSVDQITDDKNGDSSECLVSCFSFMEMIRIANICNFSQLFSTVYLRSLMSSLFSEMLLPAVGTLTREKDSLFFERYILQRHCGILYSFLERLVVIPRNDENSHGEKDLVHLFHGVASPCTVARFVDEVLHFVIPSMVIDKDYDALRLVTGFKLFAFGVLANLSVDRNVSVIGDSIRSAFSRKLTITNWRDGLDNQTKLLCLQPRLIQRILPRLLTESTDRSHLVFLLNVVLQKEVSFKELIASYDKAILREIIWELGGSSNLDRRSVQALKVAALAREKISEDREDQSSIDQDSQKINAHAIASRWVSAHFMFLLVNIVQLKWHEKALDDKLIALRSLDLMLKFLLPSEAPRFLTQLVASLSTAMSHDVTFAESTHDGAKIWRLRFLATECLKSYIDILVNGHLQTLGESLSTLVVTLFPVFDVSEDGTMEDPYVARIKADAAEIGVQILEVLTGGTVGQVLSEYFKEIPFLPSNPLLDTIKENLKSNGVDIDRLSVLSLTQTTERLSIGKETNATGNGGNFVAPSLNENLIEALQTRLRVVRPLLTQESASVRLVALQHLIDLLRANRCLFYRLIENEDPSTTTSVLTVQYACGRSYETRGAVTDLVEALLRRATVENNKKVKILLASCLGEVAAIDPSRLGAISTTQQGGEQNWSSMSSVDEQTWQLAHPPWRSSTIAYALYLLTTLLVNALKAASTSAEQHKVAHTIQQLLVIADQGFSKPPEHQEINVSIPQITDKSDREKRPMSQRLSDKLDREGVLGILEPYWASSFSENMNSRTTKFPPFFRFAENYFQWVSRWCRYMILRSSERESHRGWCGFLFSCRTVVRASAGITVTEFLLPVLVLERLCFGSPEDEEEILRELLDVFQLSSIPIAGDQSSVKMNVNERQKAVNTAFLMIDTLKMWSERETEGLFQESSRQGALRSSLSQTFDDTSWSPNSSVEKIHDLVLALPLESMANTAATLGMHARALLCLEAKARMSLVATSFDSGRTSIELHLDGESSSQMTIQHGFGPQLLQDIDLFLLREILGELDDYPTMNAIPNKIVSIAYDKQGVRQRESKGDWAGALNDYERALQSETDLERRSCLEQASLRCLLEMGQYQSVLNQVNGIIYRTKKKCEDISSESANHVIPLAIGAAWRLGRWSALDGLVNEYQSHVGSLPPVVDFQVAIGKAMLGLHRRSKSDVEDALCLARETLMTKLASIARDGYERAYPSLVRLQCMREIEDANFVLGGRTTSSSSGGLNTLSELALSSDVGGWSWGLRLEVASTVDSSLINHVRLALARLAGDARLEREIFFIMGKKARKIGLLDMASTCFAQSQSIPGLSQVNSKTAMSWSSEIQMQLAKLEYQAGQTSSALRILGVDDVKGWSAFSEIELNHKAAARLEMVTGYPSAAPEQYAPQIMATRLLKSTRWMADGGLKAVPDIMERFRVSNQLRPKWEKCHFEFAKYLDSLLEARINGVAQHEGWSAEDSGVRQYALSQDMSCQNYLHMSLQQYLEALKVSGKHVYQALPRALSLWLEYTSVEKRGSRKGKGKEHCDDSQVKLSSDPCAFLRNKQDDVNQLFQEAASRIPSSLFYTATPQLISRLCHPNGQTGLLVQTLLTRILSKFPGQAMWALAWVRNSLDKTRCSLGNEIFRSAQKSISGWVDNEKRVDSRTKLILEKNRNVLLASKSFISYLIDISKHSPKDERARSFKLTRWRGEVELCEFIPPVQAALASPVDNTKVGDVFPRFRAIHSAVQIMSSKAKPKRVKFYVTPAACGAVVSHGLSNDRIPEDAGELHFLVKNEAKGDLRKDARVQDLNIVINRLMASGEKGKRQRRLRLRTFAVTCLSEDCGIVEWVPNTESFRSLTSRSYNPQVPTYCVRRRGRRIANFGDPNLKKNFEDCQNAFFKNGDLSRAARLFEHHFLKSFPPLFFWWFVHRFIDAHAWYEARTNFTTSASIWSAVGHIIGLGDRHSENLLIDTSSGGCVHVDFDCIFDKGLLLPKPEIIPFRLTPNMIDAFGPVGTNGLFADCLRKAMTVLRQNRDTLLSVLEPFVKDPIIDWKKSKGGQRQGSLENGIRDTTQAKLSLKMIDERLRGIYNLRNPNFKKITRTDHVASDHDEEMARMVPLSVEGQVHKMISEATSHENLVQLYIGWMPWI